MLMSPFNPVPAHNPDAGSANARRGAVAAEKKLADVTRHFKALGEDHPHHIHVLFSELYHFVTQEWLALFDSQPRSEHQYQMIEAFYDLYDRHVLRHLDDPITQIDPHWRFYHRLARRLTIRSAISLHLLLISAAIRAHVRTDIGHAMLIVETQRPDDAARRQEDYHRFFHGPIKATLYRAALRYIDRHRIGQSRWRRFVLGLYRFGATALLPVWFLTLKAWRWRSYYRPRLSPKGMR